MEKTGIDRHHNDLNCLFMIISTISGIPSSIPVGLVKLAIDNTRDALANLKARYSIQNCSERKSKIESAYARLVKTKITGKNAATSVDLIALCLSMYSSATFWNAGTNAKPNAKAGRAVDRTKLWVAR